MNMRKSCCLALLISAITSASALSQTIGSPGNSITPIDPNGPLVFSPGDTIVPLPNGDGSDSTYLGSGSGSIMYLAPTWASPDVGAAFAAGWTGRGTNIFVLNEAGVGRSAIVSMIAPDSSVVSINNAAPTFKAPGLNILNLSAGSYVASSSVPKISLSSFDTSIVSIAKAGTAVVVKAAGDNGVGATQANSAKLVDVMNVALKNGASVIYAGALSRNGSPESKASLAQNSNRAGSDTTVQSKFLVVGIGSGVSGVSASDFAATVVSGYAAIVGSKFWSATATQVTNQLLQTARKDTLINYNAATYGRGEASLSRALAPVTIR